MILFLFKILLLLWIINFTPPLLAHLLEGNWDAPLDCGRRWRDGNPLLGCHKTIRGISGGVLAGLLSGIALGIPWWVGLLSGLLSMLGDITSSFIKRRLAMPSGSVIPGLDQFFEGAFPFLVLSPLFSLGVWQTALLIGLFCIGAYLGSWFFKLVLLNKPYQDYPRRIRSRTRLRELRACQIVANPLHHILNFEDSLYYHLILKTFFRMLGLYEKGKANALELQTRRIDFHFPDLPAAFDGYTILLLTDLHLDGLEGLTERLQTVVKDVPADLCLIGGDLRMETHGPFDEAIALMRRLVPSIRAGDGIIGVLGNHDCTEILAPMQELGVEYLVNGAMHIERDRHKIWIVGVDDPHYYQCHNLDHAFEAVPPDAFSILVAHSNEIYREAASYAPDLYLCGHTHAGQIQVPYFGPIFTHSRAPRRLCHGTWLHEGMKGFTSGGVGVSGVPIRFYTRGEVVLITLRKSI